MSDEGSWIDHYFAARRAQEAFMARLLIAGARWIWSAVRLLLRPIIIRHRRREALRELRGIDSRTLKDVGLHRGEIWFIADAYSRRVPYQPEDQRYAAQAGEKAHECPGQVDPAAADTGRGRAFIP